MKRALVTGGSGAIGKVICQELARHQLHVIVHGHQNLAAIEETVDAIKHHGGSAECLSFDVCDEASSRKTIERILNQGPIQVLVNNAAFHHDAPMAGMSSTQWTSVIDVSLNGFFNVTQPLLMPMMRTRWGRIITISSLSGVIGRRGQTNYSAAKAGLHGASKSLAYEVASRGITVNVVAPGLIESPATQKTFTQEQIESLVPMKRSGTPEEVAHLVGFLSSEHAGYISGQVIGINGAMA